MQSSRFWGKVRQGQKRGKELGFPTANINIIKVFAEGIYISEAKLNGQTYPALTFIGIARTFNAENYLSETYILDFNQNLYNNWLSIKLIKKIRDNQKFKSIKQLIIQMKQDEQVARIYFKKYV